MDARLRTLLERAAHHLQLHAEEYGHPGQDDLIAEIRAVLQAHKDAEPKPFVDLREALDFLLECGIEPIQARRVASRLFPRVTPEMLQIHARTLKLLEENRERLRAIRDAVEGDGQKSGE